MLRGSDRLRGPEGVRGALWRSLAVFRLATALYAFVTVGRDVGQTAHPANGIVWFGVLVVWSVVMSLFVPATDGRRPRVRTALVVADVAVCAVIMMTTDVVSPDGSADVLPALWTGSGVFSAALAGGTAGGIIGGVTLAAASVAARGSVDDVSIRPAVLFVLSGAIVGYLSRTAIRAEAALAQVLAVQAGNAERERLARNVHDSVLQVLSLIAREAPHGLAAAEVARLAADQESALRDLLRTPGPPRASVAHPPPGGGPGSRAHDGASGLTVAEVDLGPLLAEAARTSSSPSLALALPPPWPPLRGAVTVSTPGVPVELRADHAVEVVAAVRAVLDNVVAHAGPGASAWLLLEDDGDSVAVTVRDDGVGIAPGRVERAVAEGRLGLAVSVCGRIRELGGDVVVTGRPGEGTEVELRVPR
ncbi:histidine kinase [Parafrankia colletiae]|uniref:Histidine kinase n=2 Tax=Parafrankia colletiae TaxID=573497 RepID=A0A1S1RE85_9ACTN|nr:histidine kinase [Parafrankia colletiae]